MELLFFCGILFFGLFLAFAMEGESFESTMEVFWDCVLWFLEWISKLNPVFQLRREWDEIDG